LSSTFNIIRKGLLFPDALKIKSKFNFLIPYQFFRILYN
jgi:hypothetical protein